MFAVPGRITDPTTRAPHRLLQEGARLVERVDDILEELPLRLPARSAPVMPRREGAEAVVFAHLEVAPEHVDRLALRCGLPVSAVSRTLTPLECKGRVAAWPGARYARRDPVGLRPAHEE